jgi:hypothetical protein
LPEIAKADEKDLELCIYPTYPARLAYCGYLMLSGWLSFVAVDAHTGEIIDVRRSGPDRTWERHAPARRFDTMQAKPESTDQQGPRMPAYPLPKEDSDSTDNADSSGSSGDEQEEGVSFRRVIPGDRFYPPPRKVASCFSA